MIIFKNSIQLLRLNALESLSRNFFIYITDLLLTWACPSENFGSCCPFPLFFFSFSMGLKPWQIKRKKSFTTITHAKPKLPNSFPLINKNLIFSRFIFLNILNAHDTYIYLIRKHRQCFLGFF